MPKDRAFLLVTGAVALAGLVCLLGVAVYIGLPASWAAAPPAPVTLTPALNLAALPASALPPTSLIPTLPPEWTATPFPTRAAPPASQTPPTLFNASVPAGPLPSATLPGMDAGSPANAPAASPLASSSDPASSASPAATATAGPPGAPSPTAPTTTITPLRPNTPQPSVTPLPGTGSIGQRVEAGGLALTVMGISKQGDSPVHFVIDVVLENVSREQAPYDYSYFSILDWAGFSYNAALDAPEPGLQHGDLDRGRQVRGNVAFDIEPEAQGLTLMYYSWLIGYEPILVSLGQ